MGRRKAPAGFNWTQKRSSDLSEAVRRYNYKLTVTAKKNPAIAPLLPAKQTVKSLKKSIKNQRELNQVIKQLEYIYNPKAIELTADPSTGEAYLKYSVDVAEMQAKEINARRKKRLKDSKEAERTKAGRIPEPEDEVVKAVARGQFKSFKAFQKYVNAAFWSNYDEAKVTLFQKNTIRALEKTVSPEYLGRYALMEEVELSKKIQALVNKLTPEEIYTIYKAHPDVFIINEYYTAGDNIANLEYMLDKWEEAIAEL